ncbi:MAG: hypothetical protein RIS92_3054 [Verrucomicrobiota bacterium]|jgi:hypothetical protein
MCLETPQQETNMACPCLIFYEKGAASPLLGSAALSSLRSTSPQRGDAGGEKDNLQKQIYTDFKNTS